MLVSPVLGKVYTNFGFSKPCCYRVRSPYRTDKKNGRITSKSKELVAANYDNNNNHSKVFWQKAESLVCIRQVAAAICKCMFRLEVRPEESPMTPSNTMRHWTLQGYLPNGI